MVIFYEFIILIYYNYEFIFYNYWDITPVINADRYKVAEKNQDKTEINWKWKV